MQESKHLECCPSENEGSGEYDMIEQKIIWRARARLLLVIVCSILVGLVIGIVSANMVNAHEEEGISEQDAVDACVHDYMGQGSDVLIANCTDEDILYNYREMLQAAADANH
jgi:hypothetical protein